MNSKLILPDRRLFIQQAIVGSAAIVGGEFLTTPGLFAERLATPTMVEGPFYPDKMPLDTDNDLLIVNDNITPAVGHITHLHGKIMNFAGDPIRNAVVEIWQVDSKGIYLHKESNKRGQLDKNFQSFGRFTTGFNGEYYFRTIKPISYESRAPHIHMKVYTNNRERLSTQLMIKGHRLNRRDDQLREIKDPKLRELLLVEFKPLEGSTIGELNAWFDVVLGRTPEERKAHQE